MKFWAICLSFVLANSFFTASSSVASKGAKKPSPTEAIELLKQGNGRFVKGTVTHPNSNQTRISLAGRAKQSDYAYATVMSCSDSRVPVERIFDAGVMDLFIIRTAGNLAGPNELASIEYGVAYVNTPVLVVMGHTQCGAVKASTKKATGKAPTYAANIPPLLNQIIPAVKTSLKKRLTGDALLRDSEKENVRLVIRNIFKKSPATRKLVSEGRLKVVGAIYHTGEGKVEWLSEEKTSYSLAMRSRKSGWVLRPKSGWAPFGPF